jgi:GntR family transcriptional repressor for pyruvate dehydrogenase complex
MTETHEKLDSGISEKLSRSAFRAIMDRIRSAGLGMGDPLPSENELVAELGVSRTVVREALAALSVLGIVDGGGGRRARIGGLDPSVLELWLEHAVRTEKARVQQIWDVRRVLEQRTAYLAAIHRTDVEAQQIIRLAQSMREARGQLPLQTDLDIEFHIGIAAASKNPVSEVLVGAFRLVMQQTMPIGWRSRKKEVDRDDIFDQHDKNAQAIHDQDPSAAEQAMSDHFVNSTRALIEAGYF